MISDKDGITLTRADKIAIIGVGNVGSSIAHSIIVNNLAERIMLYDIDSKRLWSEKTELMHCVSILESDTIITACNKKKCFEADIVILTASEKYKVGMSRYDFITSSIKICTELSEDLKRFQGVFIVVTNPVDIITYLLCKSVYVDKNKIFGTGTILDTYRLRTQLTSISKELWCIGEHGETVFVPCSLNTYYSNLEIEDKIQANNVIANNIMTIKGMTNWGITEVTIQLLDAIINDRKTILPVSHMLKFSFLDDAICIGYPATIGKNGIEGNKKISISTNEMALLKTICDKQRKILN